MKPIAQKVAKEFQKHKQRQVVSLQRVREAKERLSAPEPTLDGPSALGNYLGEQYQVLMLLANTLMSGSPALDKLAGKVEAAHEVYMPGGPPMSPVLDSLFMTWVLCDVTVGASDETLASIIADLVPVLGLPRPLQADARACAESRLGIYRFVQREGRRATLFDLVEKGTIVADLVEDWGEPGQLWLVRVTKNLQAMGPGLHIMTTPYVLLAPERDWLDYFGRIAPDGDLATLRAHFKAPKTAEFWLEYVMDGYAGEHEYLVCLEGVPDRVESLPHAREMDDEDDAEREFTPLEQLRELMWMRAGATEVTKASDEFFAACCGVTSLDELSYYGGNLAVAFRIYGFIDDGGRTVARTLAQSKEGQALDAPLRRELQAILNGWFSVFEIRLVRVDEGVELFDTLRRKTIFVRERSLTQHVSSGEVLAAQVMTYEDGELRFEGAIAHVPRLWASKFVGRVRALRDARAKKQGKLDWQTRAGLLIPEVVALYEEMQKDPPLPQLVNFDGDELVRCEAHYDILDRELTITALNDLAEADGPLRWHISGEKALEAHLSIEGTRFTLQCNSRQRLQAIRERVESSLGDSVRWKVDVLQDGESIVREAQKRAQAQPARPPAVLPPEMERAAMEHLQGMMRAWLDQPIPMLKGKSPRQAVRTERGRAQVVELLTGQERGLTSNPQLRNIDLQFMWDELGLKRPKG